MDWTTRKGDAKSIEDMQKIAQNQIDQLVMFLEEQAENLKCLDPQNVRGWETFQMEIAGLEIDISSLNALNELGQEYGTMKAGNYF